VTNHVVAVDLAKVYRKGSDGKLKYFTTLAWGDDVEVKDIDSRQIQVQATTFETQSDGSVKPRSVDGFIRPATNGVINPEDVVVERAASRVLKVDFVDVQQGDGSVIETPEGKVILIDGGDNQLFARYLAARYRGTSEAAPKTVECICVTHGDADHFLGLTEIQKSEQHSKPYKRLFINPLRVFHNGLVKRPSKIQGKAVPESKLLGTTRKADGITLITDLKEDLLAVPEKEMNKPFREWKRALKFYAKRGPIEFRRLDKGDGEAFDFLRQERIEVEVLGPIITKSGSSSGLKFLGTPVPDARFGSHPSVPQFTGLSASHTINGHSIVLRLSYGKARFLFAGDLNEEAEEALTGEHRDGGLDLGCDVFKVPHHGSSDFSEEFLQAVSPLISVVSSGDESARKEYIHPRATLMGSLGKYSKAEFPEPLIFVTELVAFFQMEGYVNPEFHRLREGKAIIKKGLALLDPKARKKFFAFSRAAFGIVKIRTDGERLLVWTNSGQVALKEAYAYQLGDPAPKRVPLRRG
jgi:beta-lactamase superfamily II metal-dependent hydrolase